MESHSETGFPSPNVSDVAPRPGLSLSRKGDLRQAIQTAIRAVVRYPGWDYYDVAQSVFALAIALVVK